MDTPQETRKTRLGTKLLCIAVAGVGLLALGTAAWCAAHWDYVCFRVAALEYRMRWGSLYDCTGYLKDHARGMTPQEVVSCLGSPDGDYTSGNYRSFADIAEWLERLRLEPNGSERVLWFGSAGDETENVYFLVRDGKVIDYGELFP